MSARTKQYDRNRFRKVYPRFRAEPRPGLQIEGSGDVVLESVILDFNDEAIKSVTLDGPYTTAPTVTVTAVGDDAPGADINLFIRSVELQSVPSGAGRRAIAVIEASANFTGKVHIQAMQT